MMNYKKIFWICSYPKSGNTWMRSIISSLFFSNDGKFNYPRIALLQSLSIVIKNGMSILGVSTPRIM